MIFSTSMVTLLRLTGRLWMMLRFLLHLPRNGALRLKVISLSLSVNFPGIRIKNVRNCSVISIFCQRTMQSVMMIYAPGKNLIPVSLMQLGLPVLLNLSLMRLLTLPACILITGIAPGRLLLPTVMQKRLSNVLILMFAAMKKAKPEEEGGEIYEETQTD